MGEYTNVKLASMYLAYATVDYTDEALCAYIRNDYHTEEPYSSSYDLRTSVPGVMREWFFRESCHESGMIVTDPEQ